MVVWGDGGDHGLCCVELLVLVSFFGLVGWFTCLIGIVRIRAIGSIVE